MYQDRSPSRARKVPLMVSYCAQFGQLMDRKRAETALMAAKENAEKVAHAAQAATRAKTNFLANMSHEIRTPMNGVLAMTDLLSRTELTVHQRKLTTTAHQSAETLLHIINDILDFSKIGSGKLVLDFVDFDPWSIVGDALDLLAESAHKKNLELAYVVSRDVPRWTRGDPGRLRQVILNLVGNAIKFTESGEVIVRVGIDANINESTVLSFEVKDTGIGISSEFKNKVLQPFEQADGTITRRFGGTGLGLTIARQLVEAMGGNLSIESEPGKGSIFRFTGAFSEPSVEQDQDSDKPFKLAGASALIVDGNATSREILQYYLSDWGMTSTGAGDGQQALQLLRTAVDKGQGFDIVLLGMMLPGTSGLEVADAIRKDPALASIQIIFLTSMGSLRDTEEASSLSDLVCLTKPVRPTELHDQIGILLNASLEESEDVARHAVAQDPDVAHIEPALNANVLLAEDNPVNQEVAEAYLQYLGCRVDIVATGLEALAAVEHNAYDIILMDCQMPDMDGLEATRRLREREEGQTQKRRIPIIAITASAFESERERCMAAGMDDYLSKPFDQDDLQAILQRWLSRVPDAILVPPAADEQLSYQSAEPPIAVDLEASDWAIDPKALDNIRSVQRPGADNIVTKVIEMYLKNGPDVLAAMHEAVIVDKCPEDLRRAAHSLKSASANVGANRFAELAKQLEDLGREADLAEAEKLMAQAEAIFPRVCQALMVICDEAVA